MYLDTVYLAKLYIHEPGSVAVRELISDAEWVGSCGHARLELACMLHRKMRESTLRPAEFKLVFDQVESDISSGLIRLFPVSEALLATAFASAKTLSKKVFLRASDALHLVCAKEHGFREIHSSDKHLLAAAKHFGLKPRNVIK